jgi:superkiller protein 3
MPCLRSRLYVPLSALNDIRWLAKDDPLTPTKRSVVKIIAFFPGNAKGTAYGTGYVIKREGDKVWIITNRHCVFDKDTGDRGENLQVEPYYGSPPDTLYREYIAAKVIPQSERDQQIDLTILEVTGLPPDIQPLATFPDKINSGTAIKIIGHPSGKDWVVEDGQVVSLEGESLKLQVKVETGNSGGPVLDSQKRAIGIVYQKDTSSPQTEIGIAYSMTTVRKILSQWGINLP